MYIQLTFMNQYYCFVNGMEPRIKKLGKLETFSFRIDVSVEWDGCRVAQVGGDQVVAALLHALQQTSETLVVPRRK